MANKTISDLNELTIVSNNDVLLVETNTETSKVTKENLLKEVKEQLNTKSNVGHTHNEYVTDSELDAKGLATETFVTNKITEAQLGGTGGSVDLSGYATKDELNSKVSYDDFNVVTGAIWFKGADGNWSGVWHRYLVYRFEKNEFALNNGDIAVFKMKIRCKNQQDLNIIKGLRLWHNKAGSPDFSSSYTQINQQTREYTIQVTIASSQETYYQCDLAMAFTGDYYEGIEGYVFDVTVENKTTGKILHNVVATNDENSKLKHNQKFTMLGVRMDDIKITSNDLEESYIPSVKNKKIICAGDSLTNGYNGANSSYVQHVQNFYPDCTVLNKGSNGGGTDRLVNILTNMARDNANTYPIENPDYSDCIAVIINIGTNGGVSGNKNTSIPQLVEKTVADIPFQYNNQTIDSVTKYWSLFSNDWWGNMGLIIEYIKWKNPKTQIFLTPPAVNSISDTESNSPFKIREAMIELGDMYGLTVIDVIQGLGINKRNNHLFRVDYCHGNDLRNEMVGKYIAKQIYSHIYDF